MADDRCPHGLTTSHWYDEHGCVYLDIDQRPKGVLRKYCAGPPRDWYFEHGWRRQLEFQMADSPLVINAILDGAQEDIDDALGVSKPVESPSYGLWQISGGQTARFSVNQSRDNISNMVPLGWFGWGEVHWYGDTPIYDAVCQDLGFQPL